MILVFFFADAALAAVSADKLTAAAETVDGQTAVIGTSLAVCHGSGVLQAVDFLNGQHGGDATVLVSLPGDQGCSESAHDTGDVRTDRFAVGDLFKASQYGVIVEGSALYDDVFSQLGSIGNLDDFVQRVLDNRVGQPCRNVSHFRPFFLRLLYLGIHKYGAAGTQVDGIFRKEGRFGEILHRVIQRFGKGFDERTAAGGAGFI